MFKEISIKIMTINKKTAPEILQFNTFDAQRSLRREHVSYLKNEMEQGTFRIAEIAVGQLSYNGGQTILLNGQHTLTAVIETEKNIKVIYVIYDVPSPEDLSLLYQKFDNNFVRTLKDRAKVEAYSLNLDWPEKITSLVVTGLSHKESLSGKKMGAARDRKIDHLKNYVKFGDFLNRILISSSPERLPGYLCRGPVVHAMMLTFEKSRDDSGLFWCQVRDGENLKRKMPAFLLRDFLMTSSFNFGNGAKSTRKVSAHEMTTKCITAWNAFRKNQSTILKYFSDKDIPKAV